MGVVGCLLPSAECVGNGGTTPHAVCWRFGVAPPAFLNDITSREAPIMSEGPSFPIYLIIAGVVLVVIGLVAWTGALNWFGRLPGDFRVEKPGVRVYAPITSMLLVSIVLSVIAAIVRWLRP